MKTRNDHLSSDGFDDSNPASSETPSDLRAGMSRAESSTDSASHSPTPDLKTLSIDPFDADAILHGKEFAAEQLVANRYRVIRLLGKGGMGAVYAVEDSEFDDETVALKTVLPELDQDGNALRRFKREVQLARRVTHPNACRIFDVGYHLLPGNEGGNIVFVTMEYLDGETLSERIRRVGRLTLEEITPLIAQICDGLAAIHDAGIVHRDFKSANVMIVESKGRPRAVVTDFGLACLNANESNAAQSITATGTVVGSPMYMAPEQVEGKTVTPATDVYAFGIVLFEMVTGRFPFEAETALAVAVKRLREAPTSPRTFVPNLDSHLERVIMRCLERDPSARFQSVSEVARTLTHGDVSAREANVVRSGDEQTAILPSAPDTPEGSEQISRTRPAGRRFTLPASIAGIVLLAVIGWYAFRQIPSGSGSQVASSTTIEAKTTAPLTNSGEVEPPARSGVVSSTLTTDSTPPASSNSGAGIGKPDRSVSTQPPTPIQDFETLRKALSNSQSSMHVELRTKAGKSQFVEGEKIEYEGNAGADGYLYLLVFSNGNVATCIFPNGADPNNKISAGTFSIPRNKEYEFPVQEPFGTDLHVAVLSKTRLNLEKKDTYTWDEAIREIDTSMNEITSRGVGVRPTRESWQAASMLLVSKSR